jgi:hypothetical protein
MVGLVRACGASARIEPVGKIEVRHHYIPVTLVCVTGGSSGVPDGAQIAWLSISNSGRPLLVILVAAVIYCAVTQGPFAAGGGGRVQPATTYRLFMGTVGWPLTSTRGFGATGVACPA